MGEACGHRGRFPGGIHRGLVLAVLLAAANTATAQKQPQIAWLPDLAQAEQLALETGRPLLLAVNMDGESACERIVREKYRDPTFVALTRRAVCVVSSVFRHTPRDVDEEGRPIPCPRLGRVTCGEHLALEPLLYDKYLGGDRIAPRHALIVPGGEKVIDLTLLFDLTEVDRAFEKELAPWPEPLLATPPVSRLRSWRRMLYRTRCPGVVEQLVATARELELENQAWGELLSLVDRVDALPAERSDRSVLSANPIPLQALAALKGDEAGVRTRLLAHLAAEPAAARRAVELAFGGELAGRIEEVLEEEGALEPERILRFARRLRLQDWLAPAAIKDPLDGAALNQQLGAAIERLREQADDLDAVREVGKASLKLARLAMENGESGIDLYLTDARTFLSRARRADPNDVPLLLLSAEAAYCSSDFEGQEGYARRALAQMERATRLADLPFPEDERTIERLNQPGELLDALQWLGDASARLLSDRSGGDPLAELRGLIRGGRALLLAAASPGGDATDWESAASFLGAVGLPRHELAWIMEGLRRFPEANPLRVLLGQALWKARRPEFGVRIAEDLAEMRPDSGACRWYLGSARVVLADWLRLQERPDEAIEVYRTAERDFEESLARAPEYESGIRSFWARLALSRGFAHLLAERQSEAVDCLVEGIGIDPGVAAQRDGLDREALDLVDGSLEWRARGRSPVSALELMERLLEVDTGNHLWPHAVCDSELREALRAYGRNDEEVGDAYLAVSILAGERALATEENAETRRVLAQSMTILAERLLEKEDAAGARPLLQRAAPLMDVLPPESGAGIERLREVAAALREVLGEARPLDRPGR